MKPFHTYRDGLPPTPGIFATDESVYASGVPVRLGDIIINNAVGTERGVVVGIFAGELAYLIDEVDPKDGNGQIGNFYFCGVDDALVVGHAYDLLKEVARIETLTDAGEVDDA